MKQVEFETCIDTAGVKHIGRRRTHWRETNPALAGDEHIGAGRQTHWRETNPLGGDSKATE